MLDALGRLAATPDLLVCDGHGLAHPRRFGLACHLGVLTGLPAIGVGKTPLVGAWDPPAEHRGAWSPLRDGAETFGRVLRTRDGVKPVFVSVGTSDGSGERLRPGAGADSALPTTGDHPPGGSAVSGGVGSGAGDRPGLMLVRRRRPGSAAGRATHRDAR